MPTSAITFGIGHDRYAIDADVVREVVAGIQPTHLPTAPGFLVGVFNLRGEVVPLFDTAALLNLRGSDVTSTAIVVSSTAGPAGLLVDDVPKMETLGAPVGPSRTPLAAGTFNVDDGLVVLLDVEQMLDVHANHAPIGAHDRSMQR